MRASLNIDGDLLNQARAISGLPATATASVDDVLRHFVENGRRQRALKEPEGIGWDDPHHSRSTFDKEQLQLVTADESLVRKLSQNADPKLNSLTLSLQSFG